MNKKTVVTQEGDLIHSIRMMPAWALNVGNLFIPVRLESASYSNKTSKLI